MLSNHPVSTLLLICHLIPRSIISSFLPCSCIRRLIPGDCAPVPLSFCSCCVQATRRSHRKSEGKKTQSGWDIYSSPSFRASPWFWWWLCSSVARTPANGPSFLLLASSGSSDIHFCHCSLNPPLLPLSVHGRPLSVPLALPTLP